VGARLVAEVAAAALPRGGIDRRKLGAHHASERGAVRRPVRWRCRRARAAPPAEVLVIGDAWLATASILAIVVGSTLFLVAMDRRRK
jgi:hypothetical protein